MFDDIRKSQRLVLPPLEHGPECDAFIRTLEEQNEELRMTEKTRDILDLARAENHQRELEAARREGWEAARTGVEVETDFGDFDCGQMPINYVRFHYDTFESWRESAKVAADGRKKD